MNKERREEILCAIIVCNTIKQALKNLQDRCETVRGGEEDYFDNMPEGIQDSERGERASATVETLYEIENMIGTIDGEIDEIISEFETASE